MTLQEKREAKLNEIEALLDSNEFSEERHKALEAELNKIEAQIRAKEEHEARTNAVDKSHRQAPGTATRTLTPELEKRGYDAYLRGGMPAVNAIPELRTYTPLTSTTETGGEFLVPVSTAAEIEKKAKSVGAMLTIVRPINTETGNLINMPTEDDTAENGEFLADDNTALGQSNPVYGHVPISAFQWSSKQVLVPLALLQDSQFDLAADLTATFGTRYGRGVNNRITVGTDGILTVTGMGNLASSAATAGATWAAAQFNDPLNLQGEIDLAYDVNATYMMNKKTYLRFRSILSTTGDPIWKPEEYKAGLLHGRPFIINQDMPDVAVNAQYLIYGDFSKYILRRVGQMTVFRNPFSNMDKLQHSFQAFQRVAGKCVQPAAFATLTAPAT